MIDSAGSELALPSRSASRASPPPGWFLGGLVIGVAALLLVHFILRDTYWDYSEGVYALTAHLMIHGGDLYGQIVGAQPPGVFLVGAGLLLIHDSIEWLRFGVACLQLGAGLIAATIVWRMTRSRIAAALTPAAVLLTPWAIHEHGALLPELVVLPVLLGAVALAADERRAPMAGVLCGIAPLIKLPFVIPAVAILLASPAPWRTGAWALGALGLGALLATALAGTAVWRDSIIAQIHVGTQPVSVLKGYWAQAGWNLVGLVVGAGIALYYRTQALDRRLLRVNAAFAVGMVISFLTNIKDGTSLNVTVPVEAALLPLAITGTVFAVRAARRPGRLDTRSRRVRTALCAASVAGLVLVAAQSASLLISPKHAIPFLRPGSAPAWFEVMSASQTHAAVAQARACPPKVAYAGQPFIAYLAGRAMPDNQPDQFIVMSSTLRSVAARIGAVHPICT